MAKKMQKTLNLALQGGGAHGAYTWGVLDRLLEESDITIDAISGTSAGAMNAAVLVNGYMNNGRDGAKEGLYEFWKEISNYSSIFSPIQQSPMEQFHQGWSLDYSAAHSFYDMLSRMFSPYELNPSNFNPLKDILNKVVDVEHLQACSLIKLFVTASNVHTGQPRVFGCDEITIDVLLASACIPFLFQAVEIDGVPYWDGGYVGNPSIWPLIYKSPCKDVMLVQINPIERQETPKTSVDIINRLNEISFNSSLMAEMRAIQFVTKLIERGDLDSSEYKKLNMHLIAAGEELEALGAASKLNADWGFFQHLHGLGYGDTEMWLKQNRRHIGEKSSLDCGALL